MGDLSRSALQHAPWGVVLLDLSGRIEAVSRPASELVHDLGSPVSGDLPGRVFGEVFSGPECAHLREAFESVRGGEPGKKASVAREGKPGRVELHRIAGGVALFVVDTAPARDPGAEPTADDSAQLLRDYDALRRAYPFGSVATFDADHRYLTVHGRGWAALGIDPSTVTGRTFAEVWDTETSARLAELADLALEGVEAAQRVPYLDSLFEVWAGPFPTTAAGVRRGVFLSRDVTAEDVQRQRVELLDRAANAAGVGITVADVRAPDQPLIYTSGGFQRLTGFPGDEVLGRNCRFLQGEATSAAAVQGLREAIRAGRNHQVTLLNYRKDGGSFWNRLTLTPLHGSDGTVTHYVGIQEDVTEIRETELEREHQRRLSELGTLAGSIAHDFNNILMEVQGRVAIAREGGGLSQVRAEMDGIDAAAGRGKTLVRQLLAYAGRHSEPEGEGEGRALVRELIPAVTRLLPRRVAVRTRIPDEELPVRLSPQRLEQVLLNLAKNAADAMPEGGELRIEVDRDPEPGWVRIVVRDDGVGMDESTRRAAFEPFFTTKGADGTGLGLSSVRLIVERTGGTVELASAPGAGATFTIRLPEPGPPVESGSEAAPTRAGPRKKHFPDLAGMGILLVDDQPGVRDVLRRLLERRGMRVFTAADGGAALDLYRSQREHVDIVLADREMPRMSGDRLLHAIMALHGEEEVPWLALMSGDVPGQADLPPDTILIPKPFDVDEFLSSLEDAVIQHGDPREAQPAE